AGPLGLKTLQRATKQRDRQLPKLANLSSVHQARPALR
ncbi:MAG: hypothetical protein ACI8P0_002237, partial [Planctomycetaceae bacterium]